MQRWSATTTAVDPQIHFATVSSTHLALTHTARDLRIQVAGGRILRGDSDGVHSLIPGPRGNGSWTRYDVVLG